MQSRRRHNHLNKVHKALHQAMKSGKSLDEVLNSKKVQQALSKDNEATGKHLTVTKLK